MARNEMLKEEVIHQIAHGKLWEKAVGHGQAKWRIGSKIVHVRYRSKPVSGGGVIYSYNINPNTLASDFEVWICGSADVYYFIPIKVLQEIYNHPDAYVDYTHPEIRVADVNIDNDQCRYARDGQTMDFSSYRCATL